MTSKRDKLRGSAATEGGLPLYEVWDSMHTGLDVETVIYYVDYCINRKRMSLEQVDDYINSRVLVHDTQHFVRLKYSCKNVVEVYYMNGKEKIGFECAVKGLTQFRKDIHKARRQ